jgi:hypothetical protein
MSRWVALLAVAITACSQPSAHPVAQASPSMTAPSPEPSASASPTTSPTQVVMPIQDLAVTLPAFSCRLPFYAVHGKITDWFIAFPSGAVSVDPVASDGKYFDMAFSRWLPVPRSSVSPDGAGYAYIDTTGSDFVLHVVAVGSGKETLVHLSTQLFNGQPSVLDYSSDGIYLINGFEHLLAGLWLVDPASGSVRQVSKDIFPVLSAGNGIIWTEVLNPADPNPVETRTSLGTLANEIDRVDIRSGTRTEWLYEPGKALGLIGLDSRGLPLIETQGVWGFDPNAELLLVAAPNSPRSIYKGALVEEIGDGVTDAHGVWLSGQAGIYLYTNSGALTKVLNQPASPANGCF